MVPRRRGNGVRGADVAPLMGRAFAAAALLCVGGGSALAQDVNGLWLTERGLSRVRVARCGADLCGTIIGTAREANDTRNPDLALRGRSLVGVQLLAGARREGETWTGRLYNPLDGRTYVGKMRLTGPDTLELAGCILGGLICQAQTWTRLR